MTGFFGEGDKERIIKRAEARGAPQTDGSRIKDRFLKEKGFVPSPQSESSSSRPIARAPAPKRIRRRRVSNPSRSGFVSSRKSRPDQVFGNPGDDFDDFSGF